jgi:octaprenyl-diphosphate synthase
VITDIRACVADEFERVNQLIIDQLQSNVDLVENIGHYIVDAGGKRLRPLLALLAAKALDEADDQAITFAAVVEFIHTATLLHDDVVDISTLRRGRPTANAHFGNASSVLVGDFIYTRAFQLMVQLANMELLDHMADTTNVIAEGEVLQLVRAGNPSVTEAQYLEVIERKTAALFAAACKGPAILKGHPAEIQQSLESYGRHLGIAFQMVDDVLDYTGDPETTGKQVGDDLNEGKPTLPLIHTMTAGSDDDAALIKSALAEKSSERLDEVIAAVKRSGGIDYTQSQAQMHRQQALSALNHLPDSSATSALAALADLAIDRQR